jgi:serine/tyrosine/threonine adenylyltransferase
MRLNIHDTFNKELPADPDNSNTRRQVVGACFSYITPRVPSHPQLVHVADEVAALLGLQQKNTQSENFVKVFSGAKVLENTQPYSMAYAGHQFGNWAGQLGDGRAINLVEVVHNDKRWTLQLKGAGETPYSRGADGLAVLRSSIREHLCSEAMYYLGVPTTRSLSLVLTGDDVLRDVMYNGNAALEKGAIVCRVAPTFIRFGNFELLAARQDTVNLKALADYTIRYFYPTITTDGKERYIQFFRAIANNTRAMIVHWQRVGFVHGVMNTDNMSVLGLTIDYGPYGWLEDFDPNWTPNTTDSQHKRYRFGNQHKIAIWNLLQLANALYPLIEDATPLQDILDEFWESYDADWLAMMQAKLGLSISMSGDRQLINDLEETLQLTETDMTIFYRLLANVEENSTNPLEMVKDSFYTPEGLIGDTLSALNRWFEVYLQRLSLEKSQDEARKTAMNGINPKYVLRNYMAQMAIDEAEKGNYGLIDELYTLLKKPYDEQPISQKWFAKRPDWARHKIGCSMLSCSS